MKIAIRILILGLSILGCSAFAQNLELPPNLISINSDIGKELLTSSTARDDYSPLIKHYVTQSNQAYCGVASMVMVINALSNSPVLTQDNFFDNQKTSKVTSANGIRRRGMNLETLGKLLESYDIKVKFYHASNTNLFEFRQLISNNLKQPNNYVVINYLRKAIGQESGGHISPIAAYNKETDRFLILDVSSYKYPPVWVKVEELWQAINTVDSDGGRTRGFVLVSK
ncbi:MAG: glutathione gamma-glutamylcysteinyltransferase [Pseudanabaena sp.]|nr:MAG: glutathione gamma-glutamylcysteinyltransferase [Pseudanabaena sp.]